MNLWFNFDPNNPSHPNEEKTQQGLSMEPHPQFVYTVAWSAALQHALDLEGSLGSHLNESFITVEGCMWCYKKVWHIIQVTWSQNTDRLPWERW